MLMVATDMLKRKEMRVDLQKRQKEGGGEVE